MSGNTPLPNYKLFAYELDFRTAQHNMNSVKQIYVEFYLTRHMYAGTKKYFDWFARLTRDQLMSIGLFRIKEISKSQTDAYSDCILLYDYRRDDMNQYCVVSEIKVGSSINYWTNYIHVFSEYTRR